MYVPEPCVRIYIPLVVGSCTPGNPWFFSNTILIPVIDVEIVTPSITKLAAVTGVPNVAYWSTLPVSKKGYADHDDTKIIEEN